MHTLAIDIGGTKFSIAAFLEGKMVRRESRPTDREGGRDWMVNQILQIARVWQHDLSFNRCGIGFGGPVDFSRQMIARSTHVGGWDNFSLVQFIKDQLRIPAIIDNDANVGALAESVCGAGQGFDPLFYMTISTGIGGGIIINGRLFRGINGIAGEIGHVSLDPHGPICLCNTPGCLERFCSGPWLARDHQRSAKDLLQDPAFVRQYVIPLARGLRTVVLMINPARIVLGGGLSKAGDKLLLPLREELARQLAPWPWATIDVVKSTLDDDNILYGANALAQTLEI